MKTIQERANGAATAGVLGGQGVGEAMAQLRQRLDAFDRTALAGVRLGRGAELACEQIESAATTAAAGGPLMELDFTAEAREAMVRSSRALAAVHARGDEIYGLTTGFGPLVSFRADACAHAQGAGLVAHLGAGWGAAASAEAVRATMIVRAHTVGLGYAGIAPQVAEALLMLARSGLVPVVPEVGSVGASGDLIPLSFVARVLTGGGEVFDGSVRCGAAEALRRRGIEPLALSGRDALALVNGTAFMTGYASLAVARGARLISAAERLTGRIVRLLGARGQAYDDRLHAVRGHENQLRSAQAIRAAAWGGGEVSEDRTRPLQEVYSIRCAPQFLGACRDNLDHARRLIEREINGVNDNPVVWSEGEPAALHGGNFQGQQVAFAADALNAALVQTAVLAERQLDVLLNPELNGGAPPLLAWTPGATSGMAGAQITATAIVAEMRHRGGPVATSSIPTNGRNQDVVSMGTLAAREALAQTERLSAVLAIASLAAEQLLAMRRLGRAPGRVVEDLGCVQGFEPVVEDRSLCEEIERLSVALRSR